MPTEDPNGGRMPHIVIIALATAIIIISAGRLAGRQRDRDGGR